MIVYVQKFLFLINDLSACQKFYSKEEMNKDNTSCVFS